MRNYYCLIKSHTFLSGFYALAFGGSSKMYKGRKTLADTRLHSCNTFHYNHYTHSGGKQEIPKSCTDRGWADHMDANRGRARAVHAWCAHACRITDYTPIFPMPLSWDIVPWGGTLLPTCPQYRDCFLGEKDGEGPAGRGMLLYGSKGSCHNMKPGCMLLGYRQRWG